MVELSDRIYYELTYKCNLFCVHCCNSHIDEDEISVEQYKQFHNKMLKEGIKGAVITGGEPTLHPDFDEIVEYFTGCGDLVVTSNGTTFSTSKFISLLKRHKRLFLQISLDGFSSDTHDAIRGHGNFNKTMDLIYSIINAGLSSQVGLSTVIMRQNVNEILNMIEFAERYELGSIHFPQLVPNGRGLNNWSEIALEPEKQMEIEDAIVDKIADSKRNYISVNRLNHLMTSVQTELSNTKCIHTLKVAPTGNIYPCPLSFGEKNCIGNINLNPDLSTLRENIENIYNARQSLKPIRCNTCKGKLICKVNGCHLCSINVTDETVSYYEYDCKINEHHYENIARELNL